MKVKMLTCLVGQDFVVNANGLHECDADEAVRLVNNGLAVLEDELPETHQGLLGAADVAPGSQSQNVPPPAPPAAGRETAVARGPKKGKGRKNA